MSGISAGLAAYRLAFQLSPIILVNGIVGLLPGGMLPIISFTESLSFTLGVLSGNENINLDNFFANFHPMPGATLIDNAIGNYPFANQQVAANAIIAQPTTISMRMIIPVRDQGGYAAKLATMMALKAALDEHNNLGGTYTVVTPSYFYSDCILTKMTDVSGDTKQAQAAWQMDFVKPLLTLSAAAGALNSLMTKVSAGVPVEGQAPTWSGPGNAVGIPASSATPSIIPAASGLPGGGPVPTSTSIGF